MNTNCGPVIIIEDDLEYKEIIKDIFKKLNYPNEIMFFYNGQEALDFLNTTDLDPFLILSDINLPKLNGFQLRDNIRMDAKLQPKCIPYLFFSTTSDQKFVVDAYSLSVQGYFVKPTKVAELENMIKLIMEYWKIGVSPNNFTNVPSV